MADTATTPASQPSILDTVGGWIKDAGQIFASGTDLYVAADQRLKALQSINEDSGNSTTTTTAAAAPKVDAGIGSNLPSWVMPAVAVGLVLVGIFVARKMR